MSGFEHYDDELRALDARIGRLAWICGADLARKEVIVALIHADFSLCAHVADLPRAHLEELRGLLMLRYRVEEKCLAEVGVEGCLRMIDTVHAEMRRAGIPVLGE